MLLDQLECGRSIYLPSSPFRLPPARCQLVRWVPAYSLVAAAAKHWAACNTPMNPVRGGVGGPGQLEPTRKAWIQERAPGRNVPNQNNQNASGGPPG